MNPIETRPLPNAADKAALKAIAVKVITACPSLQDTAHEVASQLLSKFGIVGHDPDKIYFHRLRYSVSNWKAFTGWSHCCAKPLESMTLTQLVIHRFRVGDQDNADMLDVDAGFYTAGPEEEEFNETNEIRLHGDEVLKEFWNINFSDVYRNKLQTFWNDYSHDFRTLAKCNFLSKAIEARDSGVLTDDDFQTVVSAVIGPLSWPVSLHMLQSETPAGHGLSVCALDIDGHVATNILRIVDPKGRQIIYTPGETEPFHVLQTPADVHWWFLQQLNEKAPRQLFLSHFPLADRHDINENIADLMTRLVTTWGHSDHHMLNQKNQRVTNDAFSWMRDSTRTAMSAEADLSLTSNGDLRKKLWIGYLSAGLKVFGPMAVVGWPVALPVIGASLASMGLNIDQAVNGKTSTERKAGVIGAILSGIDALFNLPFLKGTGALAEVGTQAEAAETIELAGEVETAAGDVQPEESNWIVPTLDQVPLTTSETVEITEVPQTFQSNEILDGYTPVAEPGKFEGIYRLDSDPPYAILMNDTAYYVRYFPTSNGDGFWAIVDPERPNQFIHSIPVRLNAQGNWERMTKLGLNGGGQCLGKQCTVELELETRDPAPGEPEHPEPEAGTSSLPPADGPSPSTSTDIGLVRTPYDVVAARRSELSRWALQLRETHIQMQIGPQGGLIASDRYAAHFVDKARALLLSARRFYNNLPLSRLPLRPEIPAVNASTTIPDLLTQVFKNAPGLVIGETMGRITSMRFMIEHMADMARQGVKTLYVRRLLSDFAQADLNDYFKRGVMSKDLEQYLTRLGTDPAGQFDELALVKTARQNGIRVQATDCAATYRKPSMDLPITEQIMTNHLTSDIMLIDKSINTVNKWVVLTGVENTNTFRQLAGISELEGGIGLRIEEVDPGQGQRLSIDPGINIERPPIPQHQQLRGTVDTFYADLVLQMEAAPVSRNEQQIGRLLHTPGTYCFEKSEGVYTLFHRSMNEQVLQTPVQTLADGRYSIHRPSWGAISDMPFDSLEQLSQRLNLKGIACKVVSLPDLPFHPAKKQKTA